eukprot:scaffold1014_cov260-Pinguiococcus_pyrenoidosus.AAC.7
MLRDRHGISTASFDDYNSFVRSSIYSWDWEATATGIMSTRLLQHRTSLLHDLLLLATRKLRGQEVGPLLHQRCKDTRLQESVEKGLRLLFQVPRRGFLPLVAPCTARSRGALVAAQSRRLIAFCLVTQRRQGRSRFVAKGRTRGGPAEAELLLSIQLPRRISDVEAGVDERKPIPRQLKDLRIFLLDRVQRIHVQRRDAADFASANCTAEVIRRIFPALEKRHKPHLLGHCVHQRLHEGIHGRPERDVVLLIRHLGDGARDLRRQPALRPRIAVVNAQGLLPRVGAGLRRRQDAGSVHGGLLHELNCTQIRQQPDVIGDEGRSERDSSVLPVRCTRAFQRVPAADGAPEWTERHHAPRGGLLLVTRGLACRRCDEVHEGDEESAWDAVAGKILPQRLGLGIHHLRAMGLRSQRRRRED